MPAVLKCAQLPPILRKSYLNLDLLSNYHLISNLNYVSKLVECTVASQVSVYLSQHGLLEPRQPAYRPLHSMETAIISLLHDLLVALDDRSPVLLSLIECSVALDLVPHPILLHYLEHRLAQF